MMIATLQGFLSLQNSITASACALAPIAGLEATVVTRPGTCGSSTSSLGPIGKSVVATLTPALVASSTAAAIPTLSLGVITMPWNLPPATMSSTWENCFVASNSPLKISTSTPRALAAFWTPSQIAWLKPFWLEAAR